MKKMAQQTVFRALHKCGTTAIALITFQNPFHAIAVTTLALEVPDSERLKQAKRLVFWGTVDDLSNALLDKKNAVCNREDNYELQTILANGLKRKIETGQKKLEHKMYDAESKAVYESSNAACIVFEARVRQIKKMLSGNDELLGVEFGVSQPKPIICDKALKIIQSINIESIRPIIFD